MEVLLYLLFGAMVAVTVWGWLALDDRHRFRVSLGVPPSVDTTVGKRVGLIMYLVPGVVLFWSSLLLTSSEGSLLPLAGAACLLFFLTVQFFTIRRAVRRYNNPPWGE